MSRRGWWTLAAFGFQLLVAGTPQLWVADTIDAQESGISQLENKGARVEAPGEAVEVEGLIRLDVTVKDDHGDAVPGLSRSDFTIFDNGRPQKIVAFRAARPGYPNVDPVKVILLIDTLKLKPESAAHERQKVAEFLRQNSGSSCRGCHRLLAGRCWFLSNY